MEMGFAVPVSGSWATPDNQLRIAARAEELGYRTLWTFQRLLYPDKPESERWAPAYRSVIDPLATLAFLAGRTQRIRLGVAVLNMPFFSPVLLAKQLTAIDVLSVGRLTAGLGIGWSPEEYAAVNVPQEKRGRRADEFLKALTAIWTDDPVEFHGDFYEVVRSHIQPRPVQQPHPPVILGGVAPAALRRAGRLADGWVSGSAAAFDKLGESIETVKQAARDAGRDDSKLQFVCRGAVRVRPSGERDKPLSGSYEQIFADLDELNEQGMSEFFVDLNFDPQIGTPDADPDESMRRAEDALEAFAPAS